MSSYGDNVNCETLVVADKLVNKGTTELDGAITLNGDVTCEKDLSVDGSFTAKANAQVDGTLTVKGKFTAEAAWDAGDSAENIGPISANTTTVDISSTNPEQWDLDFETFALGPPGATPQVNAREILITNQSIKAGDMVLCCGVLYPYTGGDPSNPVGWNSANAGQVFCRVRAIGLHTAYFCMSNLDPVVGNSFNGPMKVRFKIIHMGD